MSFEHYARLQAQKTTGKLIIPLVTEYLAGVWERGERDRNPNVVHPSEMAKKDWCERATCLRIMGYRAGPEPFSFVMQSIFDEGHQIHDKWQSWLRGTGQLWGTWKCQICDSTVLCAASALPQLHDDSHSHAPMWKYEEVALRHGLVSGHEDGAIENDRLVEFKSVGVGTLRNDSPSLLAQHYKQTTDGQKLYDLDAVWKNLKKPLKSHLRQTNIYMWLAREMGLEFPNGASIVYEYKPNQQSREFVVSLDEELIAPLLDRVRKIENGLERNVPPACPYGGCKSCGSYSEPQVQGRGVSEGAGDSTGAGTPRARQATRRAAGAAGGRDRAERQQADAPVHGANRVAEVPRDAAGPGRSGRKIVIKRRRPLRDAL